jgi:uncharacterized protein
MNANRVFQVIDHFYPEDTPLKRLLLQHSRQVRDKALEILALPGNDRLGLSEEDVSAAAMLHDIGIGQCHAPGILCTGSEPYLAHGVIGARLLRDYARQTGEDWEFCARVCERHTGVGITAEDILAQHLPLPAQDFLPETPLEKLICLADKYFSKSGDLQEKSREQVEREIARFGQEPLQRLQHLWQMFSM